MYKITSKNKHYDTHTLIRRNFVTMIDALLWLEKHARSLVDGQGRQYESVEFQIGDAILAERAGSTESVRTFETPNAFWIVEETEDD